MYNVGRSIDLNQPHEGSEERHLNTPQSQGLLFVPRASCKDHIG